MRISDWSSDVCSSDLDQEARLPLCDALFLDELDDPARRGLARLPRAAHRLAPDPFAVHVIAERLVAARGIGFDESDRKADRLAGGGPDANVAAVLLAPHRLGRRGGRSVERRVGNECVSSCRYRRSPYH